jgi:predicted ferric reductase
MSILRKPLTRITRAACRRLSAKEIAVIRIMIVLLYCAVACGPAIIAGFVVDRGLLSNFSMTRAADLAALIAIAVLSIQFVLSARLRWIEKPFGLDRIMLFHRFMAISALSLLLLHPLLLAADPRGDDGWKLLYSFSLEGEGWKIIIGKAALIMLLITACVSLFRLFLKVEYQLWLRLHNILALCILAGGFIHGLLIGPHVGGNIPMKTLWVIYPALALGVLFYNRFFRAAALKARAYLVSNVKKETDSVWTLTMTAPGKSPVYEYIPGQFHFITLYRAADAHHEQHPFTISSSPAGRTEISSSIKESGDYTASIGKTVVGDRAALLGPFGRFSYALHPSERNLVFIAGGIGITPLMSMVRYMRDTNDPREVLLLYGNRKEKDIAFRQELEEIAEKGVPRLRVVHVLNQADDTWRGERGQISVDLIKKECKSLDGRVFYLCGPPVMMMGLVKNLKKAGVKHRTIRYERFSI